MLTHATTWVNSEYIIPSKKQADTTAIRSILTIDEMLGKDKSIKTKSRLMVPRGSRKGALG